MLRDDTRREWMTMTEAASFYGCSRQNIHAWVKRGLIPESATVRIGNVRLIDRDALIEAIRKVRPRRRKSSQRSAT